MNYKVIKSNNEPYYFLFYKNTPINNVCCYLRTFILTGSSIFTIRTYCYDLLELYRWLEIYKKKFKDIKKSDLYEYIAFQKQKNNSPATINRRLIICNCYFNFLFETNIQKNAFSINSKPFYRNNKAPLHEMIHYKKNSLKHLRVKIIKKIIDPLQIDQINKFLTSLTKYRDISIVLFMYLCGIRSNEVINIESDNLNLIEHKCKILGKGNKYRMIPIPENLINILNKYIKFERPKDARTSKLFVNLKGQKKGSSMTTDGLRGLFRYHRKITNLIEANPHKFRHTFGSEMAKQGMPIPVLQKLMGHESINMTMKYIHITDIEAITQYNNIIKKIEIK